ncbi:hypothetical protein AB1L30_23870 [Bremerella sp. JC817]|uniref:hypothetical protein n=1 Tax=Bremerella sp. JC817 TaxID=3231756 RepID=UPI003459F860
MKIGTLFTQSILATLLFCSVSQAGWNDFWDRVHLDYARNKCWPSPFVEADRASVNNYYSAMTAAGIRLQNTLSDHYFDASTGDLTSSGKLKVRQIVMGPEGRRAVYVMQGLSQEETEARIKTVQASLTNMFGTPDVTEVYVSPQQPVGRSAEYIDEIYRRERSSIPAPRLPAFTDQ